MEWQRIETAPRDGTLILVYTEKYGPKVVKWFAGSGVFGTNEFRVGQVTDATHWMPVPDAPSH